MSRSYWFHAIAFGVALSWGFAALPQDSRTTSEAPNKEIDPSREEHGGYYAEKNFSLPVRIVTSESEAAAADRNAEESRKHDESDLEAQWKAANAASEAARYAEEQVENSWWQLYLAAFGGFALLVSLCFNGIALRQTRMAIRDAREIGEAQVRAYLSITAMDADIAANGIALLFEVKWKNTGQTPATNFKLNIGWATGKQFDDTKHVETISEFDGISTVAAGLEFSDTYRTDRNGATSPLSYDDITRVVHGDIGFWVFGIAEYKDVFMRDHKTRFRYKFEVVPVVDADGKPIATERRFSPCLSGNEIT